ncbi:MAG: hypothetical protein M1831_001596 [Alyxoria varia]|nr:MAG: hypothetical protein M1831_001596 [Alyxoria varia]
MDNNSSAPLAGKVAIVTGASRGIGTAIAEKLASRGADVVMSYNSPSSAETAATLARNFQEKYKIRVLPVQANLSEENGPRQLVSKAKEFFTGEAAEEFKISIVVNNAGLAIQGAVGGIGIDDFLSQYRLNVWGPLDLMQAALPYLPHDRSARIVNVSSTSSSIGPFQQSVYGGTKAALESMTRTWARELSDRGTVNAVNPGPVLTEMMQSTSQEFKAQLGPMVEMTPLAGFRREIDGEKLIDEWKAMRGRPAYAEEIAGVVAMLCSADSGWCTGSVICANGGLKFTS